MNKISSILMVMMILILAGCQSKGKPEDNNENKEGISVEEKDDKAVSSEDDEQNKEDDTKGYDYERLAREVKVTDEEVTFVDSTDTTVTVSKNPERVICLYNSYSELWYLCGGNIIGRIDSTTNLPEEAKDAEIVGKITEPNIEKILELEPDLVILRTSKQQDIVNVLKENDIDYISTEYNSFEDYLKLVKIFTELNSNPELYETLGNKVEKDINNIIARVPEDEKPTALLLLATSKSVKAYLPNTTNGQMLQQLGVENIANSFGDVEIGVTSIEFSMEKLLEIDPDFIFVQSMGGIEKVSKNMAENIESDPAWSSLSAVKNDKYIFLDTSLFHYKPNEKYAEAYGELAKILYPETFK